jgi:hypothetical protein
MNINTYNKHYLEFNSIGALLDWIENTAPAGAFAGVERLSSTRENDSMKGTANISEANKLLQYGDDKGYQALERARVATSNGTRPKVIKDVVGFAPNVPAVLAGVPKNMFNIKPRKTRPVIKVYLNASFDCSIKVDEAARAFNKVFNAIENIEHSGYSVELWAGNSAKDGDENFAFFVKMKSANERISLYKCGYLLNASFHRRHGFAVIERAGLKIKSWRTGYGYPMKAKQMKETFGIETIGYYEAENMDQNEIVAKLLNQAGQ